MIMSHITAVKFISYIKTALLPKMATLSRGVRQALYGNEGTALNWPGAQVQQLAKPTLPTLPMLFPKTN